MENNNNEDIIIKKLGLEYIEIIGLYDKYNFKFKTEQLVNIFIGENGLGKTTILNCIYYILSNKLNKLSEINFRTIKIKFCEQDIYTVNKSDIDKYVLQRHKFRSRYSRIDDMIDDWIVSNRSKYNDISDIDLSIIIREISIRYHIPMRVAERKVSQYFSIVNKEKTAYIDANIKNVDNLKKAVKENIKYSILYLPTYRRIESDFSYLDFNESINDDLLIKFGMSDVQELIENTIKQIRFIAMKGFAEMTGVLLEQYASKTRVLKDDTIDFKLLNIILDRLGDELKENTKEKILSIVESGEIKNDNYEYLKMFIQKLISNYNQQRYYDKQIIGFIEVCNRYFNGKKFKYNPNTLELDIYLDKENKTIDLSQLSSGEKQIVSLFSKLYLENVDKYIIIIDEPELSLSLLWQQQLIPDIVATGKCGLLLTVTHSPFVFDNQYEFCAKDMKKFMSLNN